MTENLQVRCVQSRQAVIVWCCLSRKEVIRLDQKKIGSFLRELRKGKNLTQEQLAEHLNVSGRTVSRWETGNNMPDLSLLVELADFYDVDIREIINGERKSESMNTEEKETLQMVADYADNERARLLSKLRNISIVGLCASVLGFVLSEINVNADLPVFEYLQGLVWGVTSGALLTAVLYSTGILASIKKTKQSAKTVKIICAAALIIVVISFAAAIIASIASL
jgi:transcriptional regulator with XRE-family HTH domain